MLLWHQMPAAVTKDIFFCLKYNYNHGRLTWQLHPHYYWYVQIRHHVNYVWNSHDNLQAGTWMFLPLRWTRLCQCYDPAVSTETHKSLLLCVCLYSSSEYSTFNLMQAGTHSAMSLPYLIIFKEIIWQILDTLTFYSMRSGDCHVTIRFFHWSVAFYFWSQRKIHYIWQWFCAFQKLSFPKYFKKLLAFPIFHKGIFTVTIKESYHYTLFMIYALCFRM